MGTVGELCGADADCDLVGVCVGVTCVAGAVGSPCAVDGDCDVPGVCDPAFCQSLAGCFQGACCDPMSGACADGNLMDCLTASDDFQGFGTTCDVDRGYDEAEQSCCDQPSSMSCMGGIFNLAPCIDDSDCAFCAAGLFAGAACTVDADCPDSICDGECVFRNSGADDCEDAFVHVITVPMPGEPPKVVIISGTNLDASSTVDRPDACFPPGSPNPGWWESFATDGCAFVRIDFCCNMPVRGLADAVLYPECPCADPIFPAANPNHMDEPAEAFGEPYCPEGNPWHSFGPLTAGTYYHPVFTLFDGSLPVGDYQMHITIEACPTAACCIDGACVDGVNILECESLGGVFLAPPYYFPLAVLCTPGVCTPALAADPTGIAKNRHLSFSVLPAAVAGPPPFTALRVSMLELQEPVPPNAPLFPPPDFSAFEAGATCADPAGCVRWVGPPQTFLESQDSPAAGGYRGARLQCTPEYRDWTVEPLINVTGAEVTPSSTYTIQNVSAVCIGFEDVCAAVSIPLIMTTSRFGDVAAPFTPPGVTVQPDALDVVNLVTKFKNLPGAISKVQAQVQPTSPDPNTDVSALDIVTVVNAFLGLAYPFGGPCPCPSPVVCDVVPCAGPGACAGGQCVKTCLGGPNVGLPCLTTKNCNYCVAGGLDGLPCDPAVPPGVNPCVVAGGFCPPAGVCPAGGFCRDACGRCTPP